MMRVSLLTDIAAALRSGDGALGRAAGVVRAAFAVDRVSLARVDADERRFTIIADAGAELLSPGTALPLSTCSYFASTGSGRHFLERDFDASPDFRRPLDGVVLATGFRCGSSTPIRDGDKVVGALSLSSTERGALGCDLLPELEVLGGALAGALLTPAWAPRARVLVCHSDPLVGLGLARLVETHTEAVARLATSLPDALAMAAAASPDVVITEDRGDGLDAARVRAGLHERGLEPPLIVISSHRTTDSVRVSRRARAMAHISRDEAVAVLPGLLTAVRRGTCAPPPRDPEDEPLLTARELEVVRHLDEGLRFKQVARRLGISEATAKTHGRHLFRKLGATSRAEAVHTARGRGLLS